MMVYVYQEKIAPPGLLPVRTKPPDVPTLQYIIKSLEQIANCRADRHFGIVAAGKIPIVFV